MNKILRKKKVLLCMSIVCIATLVFAVSNVFAYSSNGNWSAYSTVTVVQGGSWVEANHSTLKGTANVKATFKVASKTMYTDPNGKLVNSDGLNRSEAVDLNKTDENIITDTNTGTKGYRYYTKVKQSPLQIGEDSIRYRAMAD